MFGFRKGKWAGPVRTTPKGSRRAEVVVDDWVVTTTPSGATKANLEKLATDDAFLNYARGWLDLLNEQEPKRSRASKP